jgi:hypothetical protein
MSSRALIRPPSNSPRSLKLVVATRILSSVPVLLLLFDGFTTLLNGAAPNVGLLIVASTVVYVVPRTALLGAVLLTAYLGGTMAMQLRSGDAFYLPVVVSILLWAGLYLRDERLRAFILEGDDAEA